MAALLINISPEAKNTGFEYFLAKVLIEFNKFPDAFDWDRIFIVLFGFIDDLE